MIDINEIIRITLESIRNQNEIQIANINALIIEAANKGCSVVYLQTWSGEEFKRLKTYYSLLGFHAAETPNLCQVEIAWAISGMIPECKSDDDNVDKPERKEHRRRANY